MSTTGKTGIEIAPGLSDAQKKTAELLHAVHLDWFGVIVGKLMGATTMSITVDGVTREEPWSGTHFVECAPGIHKLELRWNSHSIGGRSLAPLVQDITVEPSRVTELVYAMENSLTHGLSSASLKIKGTRPA